MPNVESVIEGLQIFAKYKPGKWCAAEHDIIYGPCSDSDQISDEDRKRLDEIGWFIDGDSDSWACHT